MAAPQPPKATIWGAKIDALARANGGWPDGAMVYALETIGQDPSVHILLSGDVPVRWLKNGRPKFGPSSKALKAVVTLEAYRAALAQAEGLSPSVGGN